MNKKRWAVVLTLIALVGGIGYLLQRGLARRAEQRRLIGYQQTVREYSDTLRPGITRAEVEGFIQKKNQTIHQTRCIGEPRNALADLIKIGEESAPWYCSKNNVYVAFEFDGPGAHSIPKAIDSDRLLSVSLYQRLEGCL